ncbi:MAG: M50 family metallopeptidase [Actinomycetota bacterium]
MSASLGVAAFIGTLLVMVVVHESGHFLAAKSFGIKVEEFFVGFGPRLFARRRGETTYGVKAVLLGGYVKIAGMNPWQTVPESDRPRTYGAKPAWQRAILLVAGSATHLVLATVILAGMLMLIGRPLGPSTELASVTAALPGVKAPAAAAGLRPGDTIVALAGEPTTSWSEVRKAIRARPDQVVEVEVLRGGRPLRFSVHLASARPPESSSARPIGFLGVEPEFRYRRLNPVAAVASGAGLTGRLVAASVQGIGTIFSPEGLGRVFSALGHSGQRSIEEPIGLVGGARLAGQAASAGEIESLMLFLTGFIVFVGVINMAPLPPLDGGHLLVLLLEKISGRTIDMRKVVPVAAFVVSLFVALSVALLFLDVVRPVQNPFQ